MFWCIYTYRLFYITGEVIHGPNVHSRRSVPASGVVANTLEEGDLGCDAHRLYSALLNLFTKIAEMSPFQMDNVIRQFIGLGFDLTSDVGFGEFSCSVAGL